MANAVDMVNICLRHQMSDIFPGGLTPSPLDLPLTLIMSSSETMPEGFNMEGCLEAPPVTVPPDPEGLDIFVG